MFVDDVAGVGCKVPDVVRVDRIGCRLESAAAFTGRQAVAGRRRALVRGGGNLNLVAALDDGVGHPERSRDERLAAARRSGAERLEARRVEPGTTGQGVRQLRAV